MKKFIFEIALLFAIIAIAIQGKTILYAANTDSGMTVEEEKEYWNQYTSHLYDDYLTNDQKVIWNEWEEWCLNAIVEQKDFSVDSCGKSECSTNGFAIMPEAEQYTHADYGDYWLARIFVCAHPQFYFLNRNGRLQYIGAVEVKYKDGKTRRAITLKFKQQLDEWIAEVKANAKSNKQIDLEIEAHDLICDEVMNYDYIFYYNGNGNTGEGTASPFISKKGSSMYYAAAFSMLLRGVGIEAAIAETNYIMNSISVVEIDGKYYYVDTRADDAGSYISRRTLNTSFSELGERSRFSSELYASLEWEYTYYFPLVDEIVENSTILIDKERCCKPSISTDDNYKVTIKKVNSEDTIFYTLNGNKPTSSSTKYTDTFEPEKAGELKAIAHRTDYEDSRVASSTVSSNLTGYIKYSANISGAEGTMDSSYGNEGTKLTIAKNLFTKAGYNFVSWNTSADGTGTAYKPGNSTTTLIQRKSTVTLYAQWTPIKYNIAFNKNGGKGTSINTMKNCVYDQQYTLPACTLKKSGYSFAGWNTKKDGSGTTYSDASAVKNLVEDAGTVTLFAQWSTTTYKITYHLNGGENSDKNPSEYTSKTKTFTLKNPTKKGYIFNGWYTDSKFKKKKASVSKGSSGDKDFYAKWTGVKYTIKYYSNKATKGKTSDTVCRYGEESKIAKCGYSKKGKTFKGWNTEKDGSGTSYEPGDKIKNLTSKKNGVIVLYAQWK